MINVAVLSYESTARKKLTRFLDNLACNHESLGHLIIVNNNPNNNISLTALPHKLFKRMTIINMGYNSGYAEGMNTAIRKSFQLSPQSPLILCNDDVYLTCKFLLKFDEAVRKLSSVLLENKIGVMGVTIRDRKNKMIMHAGKKLKKWTYQFKNAYKNESDKEYVFVNYISGAIWGCLPSSII